MNYSKMRKKALKIIFAHYWAKSKRKSRAILKRGPEKYKDYTPDFIFDNMLSSIKQTWRLSGYKKWKIFKAPKIYFENMIDPIIAKFPIYKGEFEKIGRNEFITVWENGRKKKIKKKYFNQQTMKWIKTE